MGGIAGEKDATGPVLLHLAFVAVEPGGPPRLLHAEIGAQRPPHGGAQLVEVHRGVVGQLVMPVPGDHAVPVVTKRRQESEGVTRRVKESFDPKGVLNPGRMWAGV